MAFLRLFKTPNHQTFSYKPRYWDPQQEEAEERRKRIELLERGGVDGMKTRISGGFRKGQGGAAAAGYRSQRVRRSNYTLLIVMVLLVIVSFLLLTVYFPDMQGWME